MSSRGEPEGDVDTTAVDDLDDLWNRSVGYQQSRLFHEFFRFPFADAPESEPPLEKPVFGGYARRAVEHAPTIVLVGGLLALLEVELGQPLPSLDGVDPGLGVLAVTLAGAGVLGTTLLARTQLFPSTWSAVRATFVYALVAVLLCGAVAATYLRLVGSLGDTILVAAGFLLASLFGAALAHDAVIRLEATLDDLAGIEIFRLPAEYEPSLVEPVSVGWLGVPFSRWVAALVVGVLAVVWSLGRGPQGLNSNVLFVVNVLVDFVIVVFLVRVLVVNRRLHRWLQDGVDPDEPTVVYSPFHPDGLGGFGLLGRAAMRVNHMIVLAGLFYVYRIMVVGLRFPVPATLDGQAVWLLNYLGPIGIYVAVVSLWLYYTIWEMHRQMVRRKRSKQSAVQLYLAGETDVTDSDGAAPALDERTRVVLETLDAETVLSRLDAAPTWPVRSRTLYGIVVTNSLPVVLSVLQVAATFAST